MSIITKYYCDHCGEELPNDPDIVLDTHLHYIYTMLCRECLIELNNIVCKYCNQIENMESK